MQALQENQDQDQPEETKEEELDKKFEEIVQQIQEQEVAQAASQKTMTRFMLFLIIFLLEYVVYKKQGMTGLIVLNVILLICYWYKDQIMEYSDLLGNYLLIIGYEMGNVLAYNSAENPDYKMPMVYGFNAIVALIYAYTYWQRLGGKQLAEKTYQQQITKLREEFQINQEEWTQIQQKSMSTTPTWTEKIKQSDYNIYSDHPTHSKAQELENLKTMILAKEEAAQKEEEMKKQAEVLEKAAEIEEKLKAVQENLGEDSPQAYWERMAPDTRTKEDYAINVPQWLKKWGWKRIKELYPEYANQSLLLSEFTKAEKILSPEEKKASELLINKLTKLPTPSPEENHLLAQLYLTPEQYLAISLQAQYLTPEEKTEIANNYPSLTTPQKLQLLNSGLNNLGINNLEKKENFVQLNYQLYQEKKNFGLTTQEKEGILRLLVNTLNLSEAQRNSLEDMGVSFFDASNWQVTNEQKENLLKFGLNQFNLTEEQQENLTNAANLKSFSLQPQQKNILTSLSPLLKENRYSEEAQELLQSLNLKFTSLSFLVNQQIIPNPHTDFGQVPHPYLTLKTKFLEGEQKTLQEQAKERELTFRKEEIQEQKISIIRSLLTLAQKRQEGQSLNINFPLDGWVKIGVLQAYQKNILLTCGFKTVPHYNYWQLLVFAVENFTEQPQFTNQEISQEKQTQIEEYKTQILTILDAWKDKSQGTEKETVRKAIKTLSQDNLPQIQQYQELQTLLSNYPSQNIKLNNLALAWTEIVRKSFIPFRPFEHFLTENSWLQEDYEEYLDSLEKQEITINKTIWERFVSSKSKSEREVLNNLDLEELINEKINQALMGYQPKEEVFYDSQEELSETEEPQPTSSTSRYDNLLDNLNQEETERQKKKKEREETRKKLEAEELKRREDLLSEKDRKLKEQEERRQREKELAELEEQKRQEAKAAREQALKEEQEAFLANQQKIIEEQQKSREEAFKNQQKEAELAEQKKRDAIETLSQQNKFQQEQLEKQKELLEKETQEKLAKIAVDDSKARQAILDQQKKDELALEQKRRENEAKLLRQKTKREKELNDLKENNKNDLQAAQDKLVDDKAKAEEELNNLTKKREQAAKKAELDKIERDKASKLEEERQEVVAIEKMRERAWNALMNYSLGKKELEKCSNDGSGQPVYYNFLDMGGSYLSMPTIEDIFKEGMDVKVNIYHCTVAGKVKGQFNTPMTDEDIKEIKILAGKFGNHFYTKTELRRKVDSLDDPKLFD